MALIRVTSPHVHKPAGTSEVMRLVILATVPGICAMTFFFGWGTLINLVLACSLALMFEAICIKARHRPISFYLKDNSALVTAVLLALSLPPFAPWWLTTVAVFVAIVIAKQLYGGIGQNPFNPAMIAYALVLISFPIEMTRWTAPFVMQAAEGWQVLSFTDTLSVIFGGWQTAADAFTSATPLDEMRHRAGMTTTEIWRSSSVLANIGAWHAVSAAYLMGGIFLLYKKIFTWHTPASLILTLAAVSLLFYVISPDNYTDPIFHISVGATIFGAFFIATDPVSAATSNIGKIWYGAGIGLLIYIIRTWGNYPDAVAFSVLIMNLAAPFIDQYTQPRTYGHKSANRGMKE
ncbi:electron transport complex subunit RsxD [Neptunomonas phycophila]|uniref:Ion-translocating oxidoreductase complex subunit D n=1 Tax=Neptunomonas phycophila TaxID=1572645 RepID=A0ABT9ETU9_9GAMM|nr:electron transport complex subunit RsxD [Neptunomonas phycophila]MDO6782805.1 electron transport complex subunit RsxD [Neptunomonas phycophila]MDP2522167.1 electron transport complex subunit RsxD [Neptunomonas phycophila]QLE97068.1 electron transport complex subunit RsxD [Neptunomonas phycophila]